MGQFFSLWQINWTSPLMHKEKKKNKNKNKKKEERGKRKEEPPLPPKKEHKRTRKVLHLKKFYNKI